MTADRTAPDLPAAGLEPAGVRRRRHRVRPAAASVTGRLADATHPAVRDAAARLAEGCASPRQQLERFVLFVRDDIRFGFPPDGDLTAASGTLALGIGQCNTKGTLLLALCRAAGIPARLHFAPIRRSIQRGLYTGAPYAPSTPGGPDPGTGHTRSSGAWQPPRSASASQSGTPAGKARAGAVPAAS
jgi:transglutaminase-like putative cysteine protease